MIHSYPWYIQEWALSRARAMLTMEERGLYREVLDLLYNSGGILQDDDEMIRKLCGCEKKEWNRSWPSVKAMLDQIEENKISHPKVRTTIEKLEAYHKKRVTAGKNGAQRRWKDIAEPKPSYSSAMPEPIANAWQTDSLPLPLPLPQPLPLPLPHLKGERDALPLENSPFDQFSAMYRGPIEDTAWRIFGQYVNGPDELTAILENTPLWMETKAYADGFHGAIKFIRSGVWKRPPKEQPPELVGGKLQSSVMRAAQIAFGGNK